MIIATTLMTLLTPYWYMFIIIHAIFIAFIIWQNIFYINVINPIQIVVTINIVEINYKEVILWDLY